MARKPPPTTPPEPVRYYERLLFAYLYGHTEIAPSSLEEALTLAGMSPGGLKQTDKFKRRKLLPRIEWVLQQLRGSFPATVLDVGCGRGTAAWPIIEQMPEVLYTGTDEYPGRGEDLRLMRNAGISEIYDGLSLPAQALTGISDSAYDAVLCLEVLEHLETDRDVEAAAGELLRVSRDLVLVSVPSVKDGNPDHKRLFTAGALRNLFLRAGAARVELQEVPKHFVVSVRKNP